MTSSDDGRQGAIDGRFMREALALGWRQQGLTSPNPSVGSVIVRTVEGAPVVVGLGATQEGGRPHGEPVALAMAGEAARGATMYVSLEPCSHHGRAGPCSDAIIAAGVARVVTGVEDPDPRVAGQGHARMRAAGVTVHTGVLADDAFRMHRGHILRVTLGRPLVTLKLARTADGFAARAAGGRLLITGAAANDQVHLMRVHADAIMVGVGTVLADDPQLTVRLPGLDARSPIRVVLDSTLRLPPDARLVAGASQVPTWVVTTDAAPADREQKLAAAGVVVIRVAAERDGRVSLPAALAALAQRGIARVFSEGGPALAEALAGAGLIDEALMLTGPQALPAGEGGSGLRAIGPALAVALADPAQFRLHETGYWGLDRFEKFERPF